MLILCLSVAVAFLDQLTKHLVRSRFAVGDQVAVIPGFFSLTYVQNSGAAWGIMQGLGHLLVAFSFVMLVVVIFFRRSFIGDGLVSRLAVGLMIAGIVGNLIDRVRLGYVVDFLMFYYRSTDHSFPSFNVADAAICTGVGFYLLSQMLPSARNQSSPASEPG